MEQPGTGPGDSVTFQLTEEDARAFYRFHHWLDPPGRRATLLRGVYLLGLCVVMGLFQSSRSGGVTGEVFRVSVLTSGTVLVLASPVMLWLMLRILTKNSARTPHFREPVTVELSPAGLRVRDASGERLAEWTSIARIASTPEHLFLYGGGPRAHLVPGRAFPSAEAAEAFERRARELQQSAVASPSLLEAAPGAEPAGGYRVSISTSEADIRAFCRFHLLHHPRGRLTLPIMLVGGGVMGASLGGIPGAALGLATALPLFILLPWLTAISARKIPGALGPGTIALDAAGIHIWVPGLGESFVPWKEVPWISASREYLFLYLDERNAIPIRKDAFPAAHEAEEFHRAAREWQEAGRSESVTHQARQGQ